MAWRSNDVERILKHKFGFTPASGRSASHRWLQLNLPGMKPVRTMLSHGNKEIGHKLEASMAQQLRVRADYFRGMLACTKSQDDYYQHLMTQPEP
jgi:hypothetical protein